MILEDKDIVLNYNKKLIKLGLVIDTFGNCSKSLNNNNLLIKPSGVDLDNIHAEDI